MYASTGAVRHSDFLLTRPKFLVHKNKQRLTKIVQYLIRSRRLNKATRYTVQPAQNSVFWKLRRTELVTMPSREVKREIRKEAKVNDSMTFGSRWWTATVGWKFCQNTDRDWEETSGKNLFTSYAVYNCGAIQERLSNGTYNSAYTFSTVKYAGDLQNDSQAASLSQEVLYLKERYREHVELI